MSFEPYRRPGEIDAAASLGVMERAFGGHPWWKSKYGVARGLGVVAIGGWVSVKSVASAWPYGLAMVPLMGLAALGTAYFSGRSDGTSLVLHQAGLVLTQRKLRTVIRFDEVRAQLVHVQREDGSCVIMHVTLDDGAGRHRIPIAPLDATAIVDVLRDRTLREEHARARASIDEGGVVRFGDVTMDREGLRTPYWWVRWDMLSDLRVEDAAVKLFRGNVPNPSACVYWETIPSPLLFTRLAVELGGRPAPPAMERPEVPGIPVVPG